MDESTGKALEHFWSRIGSAEHAIYDYTGPRLPPFVAEDMDDSWFEDYKAIRESLKPQARLRSFIVPAEVPGHCVFQAETAHEALMFILNPPDALFGLPYVLTSQEYLGIKREAQNEFRRVQGEEPLGAVATEGQLALRPRWDRERRILWFGTERGEEYRQPAVNQIMVLEKFEKDGWPTRIDDPFEKGSRNAYRQRTSDTIRALNRKHKSIWFKLSGDSKGILWQAR